MEEILPVNFVWGVRGVKVLVCQHHLGKCVDTCFSDSTGSLNSINSDVIEACFPMNSQRRSQACHMPETLAPHVFLSTKKYFENRRWQMCGRRNFRPIEGVEDVNSISES